MIQLPDYNYRKHLVLFVDDEPRIRKHFAKIFGRNFRVILADDGLIGLERFREYQDEIGVIISDQRMPKASGTDFLAKVARLKPSVSRIISTAYADMDAAIAAINEAGVYRYVTKPWDIPELTSTLKEAMDLHIARLEQEKLVRQNARSKERLIPSERISSLERAEVQTGEKCPRSGIWMVDGTRSTTAKITKGQIMPQFRKTESRWKLIALA